MDWREMDWTAPGARAVARDHLLDSGWSVEGHDLNKGLVAVPTFTSRDDSFEVHANQLPEIYPRMHAGGGGLRYRTGWEKPPLVDVDGVRCRVVSLQHFALQPMTVYQPYRYRKPRLSTAKLWQEVQEVQSRASARLLCEGGVANFAAAVRKVHDWTRRYGLNPFSIDVWAHGGAVPNSYRYPPDATWLYWSPRHGAYASRSYAQKAPNGNCPWISASVRAFLGEGAMGVHRHQGRAYLVRR